MGRLLLILIDTQLRWGVGGRVWGSGPRLMVSNAHKSAGTTAPNSAGGGGLNGEDDRVGAEAEIGFEVVDDS